MDESTEPEPTTTEPEPTTTEPEPEPVAEPVAESEPEPEPVVEPEPDPTTTVDTSMSVESTTTKVIVNFDIANIVVIPFKGAMICITFSYESGESFEKCLDMSLAEYNLWGDDDDYVFQFVKDNIASLLT
jgi:hypothetical protein